jgi:hypothetical protein
MAYNMQLRRQGHDIKMRKVKNDHTGSRFAVYYIEKL